ncbi:hypothetical protein BROC_00891 [Candidatus Brocadiaceae bacterium]|nr:hypothetical protein BROC_00891 [Candidatus Brocadiaceae bacterium]
MDKILQLQSVVNKLLDGKTNIKALEAGCGSYRFIQFDKNAYVIGIDISEKQLQLNSYLSEKILGDIQYYDFQNPIFDVIICWNVLEHLPKPELALENFAKAIKDDSIIVLALPNVLSLKGIVTKFTPHWFHILFYRYIWGIKNAGKNDTAPFKCYLKFSLRIQAIKRFAINNSLRIVYFDNYDVMDIDHIRGRSKILYVTYKPLMIFLKTISFGKLGCSDFFVILQKTQKAR